MSAALNIGARALTANLATLHVIGHNIANVNTAGYSRQSVQMQTSGYQNLGGNYFGKGVEIASVARMHSAYLTREAQLAASVAATDAQRLTRLQQLENLFPVGDKGLGAAVGSMLNAWSDVASAPTNLSARVVVLARGEELAARLRDTASGMDALAHNTGLQMHSVVSSVNRLAQDLARVNQRIIENHDGSGTPNDLLDQRDTLLGELSRQVQISTVAADDGSVGVFVAGSQPLVLGAHANHLQVSRDSADSMRLRVAFVQGNQAQPLGDAALGGALGGMLDFLDQDLAQMQNLLGRMALALNTEMNAQQRLGMDLRGQGGGDFFVPAAAARGIAAAGNTGTAQIAVTVSDASALRASDYELRFDAGGVSVLRLADGLSRSFASLPVDLDGLRFELPAGAAASGDRFLLRPFTDAARNLQMALVAPDRLAAASPVQVTPAPGNSGAMAVESLYAAAPLTHPADWLTLSFLADGSFTVSGPLGPDTPPPDNPGPPPSYNYTPGQALHFNGWSLTLRGNPSAGDSFAIGPAVPGAMLQNAGNARAVLALREQPTFDGVALADGYGVLLSFLGTQVQGGQFAASYSAQVARSTEDARAAVAGVNLDEEAARLLQFQQAYQASAKFLQVAQNTFDILLQTVGR